MSAAAAPRKLTRGWTQIPVSLIENQTLLTPAELSLSLIVIRRSGGPDGNPVEISDSNWSAWTGKTPRLKEMAIRGLLHKGLSAITVKGFGTRYTWQSSTWDAYLRQRPEMKPRTAGRSVDPKPGAKVHADCRDHGCAMLRAECSSGLCLVPATPVAKPVSRTTTVNATSNAANSAPLNSSLTVLPATPVAKPVSRTTSKNSAEIWAKTLATLQAIFPIIGIAFLLALVKAVGKIFSDVSDDELSRAVDAAWAHSGRRQKSPGLFLHTVPETLAALRKVPKPPPEVDHWQEHLKRVIDALEAKDGQLYRRAAGKLRDLPDFSNPEALDAALDAAEADFVAGARSIVDSAEVDRRTTTELRRHAHLGAPQQMELRKVYERRFVFEALGVPRFGVFA